MADAVIPVAHSVWFSKDYQPVRDGNGFTLIGENADNRSYCLLEVEDEAMAELQEGKSLYFKEGDNGSAVLCTSKKAYTIEFHENSNSLFLARLEDTFEKGKLAHENLEVMDASGSGKHGHEKEVVGDDNNSCKDTDKKPMVKDAADHVKHSDGNQKDTKRYSIFAAGLGRIVTKVIPPDTSKLKKMLEPHSLGEINFENNQEPPTTAQLEYNVAASSKEIQEFLEAGPCVQDGGAWRWLPKSFEREILEVTLDSITAKGWSFANIDPLDLLKVVQGNLGPDGEQQLPSVDILVKVLSSLAAPAAEPIPTDSLAKPQTPAAKTEQKAMDLMKISLDSTLVRRFRAEMLLSNAAAKVRARFSPPVPPPLKRARLGGGSIGSLREAPLRIEEFMYAWRESLGIGAEDVKDSDLAQLYGVIAYENLVDGTVHSMDGKSLSLKPLERLKALFNLTSHWKPDILEALMRPTLPNQKPEAWLMKYTRTVHLELEEGKETRVHVKKFNMGGA